MLNLKEKILMLLEENAKFLFTPHAFIWQYLEEKIASQNIYSALNRLKKEGLVEKISAPQKLGFRINQKGKKLLADLLVPEANRWDGYWRIVSFDFPETRRNERTHLRRRLRYLGFGKMHRSVWISPHNLLPPVRELVFSQGSKDFVWMFEAKLSPDEGLTQLVFQAWPDLGKIKSYYNEFILNWYERLERFHKEKKDKQKILRKPLIRLARLELGKISSLDPKLPADFLPADWPANLAFQLLRKIKREVEK